MNDEFTFTLNHPITEEQWDMIEDVDFDNTNEIMFYTKHGKEVKFVKASAQPERKTGQWLNGFCSSCGKEAVTEWNENGGEYLLSDFCPFCGADTREAKRMSNLIDRQAAISLAKDLCVPTKDGTVYRHRCIDPDAIRELPSAQPEITHCAECIHWKHSAVRKSYCEVFDWMSTAEDFCSFAERKDDEE